MKKICSTVFLSAIILGLFPYNTFGKDIKGPNISAIYRIETLAQQLPPLLGKRKLVAQEPFPEPSKIAFQRIFGVQRTLALETGRLPAFQGEIKEKEIVALVRLTDLFENATPEQKTNLESLLLIGFSQSRRYSSPLEAILWTLERDDYDRNKPILQLPLEKLLDVAWDFSDRRRWEDYEAVTDRLSAPELLNYYQRIKFIYESKSGKRDAFTGDARGLFVSNVGNCYDHADFATYCLEKSGYKTSVVGVHPIQPSYHVVCQFESDGKSYFIDNGRPDKFFRRGITPKEEYEMYRDKEILKKGGDKKDPVYLLQDNHGLVLVYLMDQEERVTSIKAICKALGLSGYEEKVKTEYLPALINNGFITKPSRHKGGGPEDFKYSINDSLCQRFKAERYHRPQNAAAKW